MLRCLLAGAATLALVAGSVSAATLTSTFDGSTEGWSGDGMTVAHETTGGNPGGFLKVTDSSGSFGGIFAPAIPLGVSFMDGGTLSFDYIALNASPSTTFSTFGTVTITGGGFSVTQDLAPTLPSGIWQTASGDLTAAFWGVSQVTWEAIISDVTSVRIETEWFSGISEIVGIDNISVSVSSVPVPASVLLLGGAMAGLGLMRQRRV